MKCLKLNAEYAFARKLSQCLVGSRIRENEFTTIVGTHLDTFVTGDTSTQKIHYAREVLLPLDTLVFCPFMASKHRISIVTRCLSGEVYVGEIDKINGFKQSFKIAGMPHSHPFMAIDFDADNLPKDSGVEVVDTKVDRVILNESFVMPPFIGKSFTAPPTCLAVVLRKVSELIANQEDLTFQYDMVHAKIIVEAYVGGGKYPFHIDSTHLTQIIKANEHIAPENGLYLAIAQDIIVNAKLHLKKCIDEYAYNPNGTQATQKVIDFDVQSLSPYFKKKTIKHKSGLKYKIEFLANNIVIHCNFNGRRMGVMITDSSMKKLIAKSLDGENNVDFIVLVDYVNDFIDNSVKRLHKVWGTSF